MRNLSKLMTLGSVALGIAVALAAPVSASGLRDGLGGLPNSQCVQNCRLTDRLCDVSARTDAQACKQSTCSSELQAVAAACTPDATTAECQTARSALSSCEEPCRSTFQTAVDTCRTAQQTCRTACGPSVPNQPDPQCVAGCRSTLQTCRLTASTGGSSCFTDCKSLITEAEQACGADPTASACTTAIEAAQACVQPCEQTEQAALQSCLQAAQSCIAACPAPAPTPAPTS